MGLTSPSARFTRVIFEPGLHFGSLKRDPTLAVDESLYAHIEGSTDSELLFHLALTFGLEDDPPAEVERMVGFVEEVGHRHGTEHPIQMTIGTTDARYALLRQASLSARRLLARFGFFRSSQCSA
jgi:hypothetical protein